MEHKRILVWMGGQLLATGRSLHEATRPRLWAACGCCALALAGQLAGAIGAEAATEKGGMWLRQ